MWGFSRRIGKESIECGDACDYEALALAKPNWIKSSESGGREAELENTNGPLQTSILGYKLDLENIKNKKELLATFFLRSPLQLHLYL